MNDHLVVDFVNYMSVSVIIINCLQRMWGRCAPNLIKYLYYRLQFNHRPILTHVKHTWLSRLGWPQGRGFEDDDPVVVGRRDLARLDWAIQARYLRLQNRHQVIKKLNNLNLAKIHSITSAGLRINLKKLHFLATQGQKSSMMGKATFDWEILKYLSHHLAPKPWFFCFNWFFLSQVWILALARIFYHGPRLESTLLLTFCKHNINLFEKWIVWLCFFFTRERSNTSSM